MEELMKQILGDMYKENMTEEELKTAISSLGSTKKEETTNTVPLDKYTSIENELKALKKAQKQRELEEQKRADENKSTEERLKELLANNESLQAEINRNKVERILSSSGLNGEEISTLVAKMNIASEDDATEVATAISSLLNSRISSGVQDGIQAQLNKLGELPNGTATQSNAITKADFDKMTYTQQMKFQETEPELFEKYMSE